MTYSKIVNKDLENNMFENDGGDLWIRKAKSFCVDQEVCWKNDILNFIREINLIKNSYGRLDIHE